MPLLNMMKNIRRARRFGRFLAVVGCFLAIFALLSLGGVAVYLGATVDTEADAILFQAAQGSRTTRLYYNADRGGQMYHAVEWESERLYGAENAIYVPYGNIPNVVKNAFLAAEDHRFFEHGGVDLYRTAKAVVNHVFSIGDRFGGSSITQQLVKNLSGDTEQTVARKLREGYRAIALERRYSKEEILELYLNIVPMGENCIGIGAGAERYFGKTAEELTLAECAALAAIINAPARYDPLNHPDANRERRNLILGEMLEYGMISEEEHRDAVSAELSVRAEGVADPGTVRSWYTEVLIDDVLSDLCEKRGYSRSAALRLLYSGGLRIYTLADPEVQEAMESTFEGLSTAGGVQYAGAVVDPATGDLLGIVGGAGEKTGNRLLNYATVPHAPGSALKPLSVYAPALDAGLISSASVFDDVPLDFYGPENRAWPKNSPEVYQGLVDLGSAIATSKNTVSVRVLRMLGKERSYAVLGRSLGLSTLVRRAVGKNGEVFTDLAEAPLALGQLTYGVSLRELTSAYTSLAGNGNFKKGRTYLAVYDNKGKLLLTNESSSVSVFSPQTASIMTKLLEGVVDGGTANGVRVGGGIPVAGKTGTSSENRDKWFVGYSPYYLCGIWCGSQNGTVAVAGRPQLAIFNTIMGKLHQDVIASGDAVTEFKKAPGVYECRFCRDGGGLLTADCLSDPRGDRSAVGWFTAATLPTTPCTCHVGVLCHEDGGVIAEADGTPLCHVCPPDEGVVRRGLLRVTDRAFPVQVKIRDAQYVYRPLENALPGKTSDTPYFINTIPEGCFVGLSPTEDGTQYNSSFLGIAPEEDEDPFGFYRDLLG